ncbi:MAG: hypothetical protein IPH51_20695 [Rubrivivax sp.]|nr:hypothetical protein [Rubrivivax sp.]
MPRRADAQPGSDLGLCGPLRSDFAHRADYCGLFRTPTLQRRCAGPSSATAFYDRWTRCCFYARGDSYPQEFYPRWRRRRNRQVR